MDIEQNREDAGAQVTLDQQSFFAERRARQVSPRIQSDGGASAPGFGGQKRVEILLNSALQPVNRLIDAVLKFSERDRGDQKLGNSRVTALVLPYRLPSRAESDDR